MLADEIDDAPAVIPLPDVLGDSGKICP